MHEDAPTTKGPIEGGVTDRPWGITLAALGLEGRTGQLTVAREVDPDGRSPVDRPVDRRPYHVVFLRGMIVGAQSPLAADTPIRVALTSKLITAEQATELRLRVRAARPGPRADTAGLRAPDDVAIIAEALRWSPAHADALRDAVIARCAARTFAIDRGRYVLEDRITHTGVEGNVDVRAVVYLGVRMHLSEQRLLFDLRQLGSWFVLKPKAVDDLSGFGFGELEVPILEALRGGTNLAALEARRRDIDPRTAQAAIYALAACDAVVCCEPPAMTSTGSAHVPSEPTMSRVPTPRAPTMSRVPTPREPTSSMADTTPWGLPTVSSPLPTRHARGSDAQPPLSRGELGRAHTVKAPRSPTELFLETRATTVRPNALAAHEVKALIVARATLLDLGADHFTILGLPPGASPDEVHAAYVELARYLEPKRLAELGIPDDSYTARRLFAQICIAVTTLTDPARRKQYVTSLRR